MDLPLAGRLEALENALLSLDREEASRILYGPQGLAAPPGEAEAMVVPVLERIGTGWEEGRVSLSQVYMSGRLCEELMDALRPVRSSPLAPTAGLAIAILEDYHSLGMKLVSSALRSGGLEALDYGRMEVGELVERAGEDGTRVLLVSVLMLRSALRVRDLRSGLEAAGLDVRLGVGGAPFRLDAGLWKEVGADGTAGTASGALDLTRRLLAETAA